MKNEFEFEVMTQQKYLSILLLGQPIFISIIEARYNLPKVFFHFSLFIFHFLLVGFTYPLRLEPPNTTAPPLEGLGEAYEKTITHFPIPSNLLFI